tara:strand:- start:15857 stop:16072 length:216 start_codon:yes stop_codon:yes gene_type:complete
MKLPFDVPIIDTEPQVVKNRFGGGSATLTPEAVAVYDTIIGAEQFHDYETVQKGLAWFVKHYPEEYMVLLD